MNLINRHVQANRIRQNYINRWLKPEEPIVIPWLVSDTNVRMAQTLKDLGENPNPEEVEKLLGRDRILVPDCEICEKPQQEVIEFVPSDRDGTVYICGKCLLDALKMVDT